MKKTKRMFLTGLSLLLMLAPLQTAAAQNVSALVHITQVDNSKFPQVTVYVSATDAKGEPLAVNPDQLQISENGVSRTLPTLIGRYGHGCTSPLGMRHRRWSITLPRTALRG